MTEDKTLSNRPPGKTSGEPEQGRGRAMVRRGAQILVFTLIWFGSFFLAAGTLNWPRAWMYLGFSVALLLINLGILLWKNPGIIAERGRRRQGTKTWDKIHGVFFAGAMLATPVVAGLDAARYQWTELPMILCWPGLALVALGNLPIVWAMIANPYLEQTVRIQTDRGQQVISSGPYGLVRHPMYAGMLLQQAGIPLALGSLAAYLPVAATAVLVVIRIMLEERTLHAELPGYTDYTSRTKYRLLPRGW